MTNDLYTDFVAVRMKGGEDIHASLTPGKCDLLHGAIGVAGDSPSAFAKPAATASRRPLSWAFFCASPALGYEKEPQPIFWAIMKGCGEERKHWEAEK